VLPYEYGQLIAKLKSDVKGIDKCVISTHCHNDLGMAVANSLAGVRNGARQVECTVNGLGERAGNAAMEEVVMAIRTRQDFFGDGGLSTNINTKEIYRTSQLVSQLTGFVIQPNKAIVGANAFAHEAGIHQDGMLKNQMTYEIMRPEMVGVTQSRLVLGKHSGRHALKARLEELGYTLDEEGMVRMFERFKALADKKKTITDADLEVLLSEERYQPREVYKLDGLQVACGTMGMPTATVRLLGPDGALHVRAAVGTGPVDATYKAIDAIVRAPNTLQEFVIHAVTEGIDALGEVTVRVEGQDDHHALHAHKEVEQPRTFGGYGTDTDIVVASAKAYLTALNKMMVASGAYGPAEIPAVIEQAGEIV